MARAPGAQALAVRAADDEAVLRANEAMVQEMPIDTSCGSGGTSRTRFCPWHATVAGCPLSHCPLSHNALPSALATWKFRLWALEAHNGWIGEPCNEAAGALLEL